MHLIALDLADAELGEALAEAIEAHPALTLVGLDDHPDLVVSDRDALPGGTPSLHLDGRLLAEDSPPDLIVSAAHLIATGFRLEAMPPARRASATDLTRREREVLALMVDGAPNKVIARTLGISERTAKFHVAAIRAKLGARNRAEVVAIALREGLVVL